MRGESGEMGKEESEERTEARGGLVCPDAVLVELLRLAEARLVAQATAPNRMRNGVAGAPGEETHGNALAQMLTL